MYDRGVLVNSNELAGELVEALGNKDAYVLRGHGIVTVGQTVQQAVVRAISVDSLADPAVQSVAAPQPLPAGDFSSLPDLGTTFNDDQMWRYQESDACGRRTALEDKYLRCLPAPSCGTG